jgi:ATP-binding cassette subfamily B protein
MKETDPIKGSIHQGLRINRALRLVWQSAPGWTLLNLCLIIIQGVLPLVALYLMKQIIDGTTAGFGAADQDAAFQQVLFWIILALVVGIVTALSRSLSELTSEAQSQYVTDTVSDILHAKSIAIDLAYYEDSNYYNTMYRAQREAPYRPSSIVNGLIQVGQSGISLLGVAAILLAFYPLLGLVLFVIALIGALVRLFYARKLNRFEDEQSENERFAWYYHWIMTDSNHAKEVRLFNLGDLFQGRFRDLRKSLRQGRLSLSYRRSLADFIVGAISSIAIFATLALAAYQAIQGIISLGDMMAIFLAFQIGLSSMRSIMQGLAGLYEDNLFLSNFYQFLDIEPTIVSPANPKPIPGKFEAGVVFEGVNFTYPNSDRLVLENINLKLKPGQVIALVGENGSGKTTLAKLLCQLYYPTHGKITLEGSDLRQFDPIQWRKYISVVFQDYAHYYLSAWENIWLGDVSSEPDREGIIQAARLSGVDPVIQQLPKGYDTYLGHWFESGIELSTGEWHKVALARAFMRDTRIIVLDEPTSSLDPLAEAQLFHNFRQLIQGRSAILISHRFSTVSKADYIYVLDNGRIVEKGRHQDLLEQKGHYADLYLAQAEHYLR